MRLFVAITLPDRVLDRIEALQSGIPCGQVIPRDNLHLTLAFAGEVDPRDAEALHDALSDVSCAPVAVVLRGLAAIGQPAPHLLWTNAEGGAGLARLRRAVRGALHVAGIAADRQRFRPHVTLARFRAGLAPGEIDRLAGFLSAWGGVTIADFIAADVALFRSHLGRHGARHERLERYALGPG